MKTRFSWLCVCLCLMAFAIVSCVRGNEEDVTDTLHEGDRLPSFGITWNGGELTDHDLQGKPAVVVFFRTRCPDCQEELPHLQQLYDKYYPGEGMKIDEGRITLLLIGHKETSAVIAEYWDRHGLTLPYFLFADAVAYEPFGLTAVPTVLVCDKNGIIRHITKDNPVSTFTQLDAWVQELLAE